ncbi:hypothetical protein [Microbacterium sp. P04]|uniref:hypothetical protein n=1 Tax=Microbacterium sp. P04 TaxID=3366947 RepID=UPI0037475313
MHIASSLSRRALELSAAVVVAVVAFLLVLLPLLIGGAVDELARTTLAEGRGDDVVLVVRLPGSQDTEARDASVRAAIAASFGPDGADLALDVAKTADGDEVQWTLTPRAAEATAEQLAAVPAAWRGMRRALAAEDFGSADPEFSGSLVPTALEVTRQADALRASLPLALTVVALVAVVSTNEIARLLAARGAPRALLLWSRGARLRRLLVDAGLPAAAAIVVGAAAGAGAGLAAAQVAGQDVAPASTSAGIALGGPLAAACVAVALVGAYAWFAVRSFERPEQVSAGSRVRRASIIVSTVLLLAAAIFSGWQLLLYAAASSTAEGARPDAVQLLAPVLGLSALILVGVGLFALLQAPLERTLTRRAGPFAAVWVRGAFRRGAVSVTPIVLSALAIAQLVVAAGFAGSWSQRYDAVSTWEHGTAVRVTGETREVDPETLSAVAGLGQVARVASIRLAEQSVSAQSVAVLAASAPTVAELVSAPPAERARLAAAITPDGVPGWEVDGGQRLELALEGSAVIPETTVTATFVDDDATVVTLESTPAGETGRDAQAVVPTTGRHWRLVSLEITGSPSEDDEEPTVTVEEVRAGDAVLDPNGWIAVSVESQPVSLGEADSALTALLEPGVAGVRFIAPISSEPLPVVASEAFLAVTGLKVGSSFRLPLWALEDTTAEVVAVVPAIPGSDLAPALLIDARTPLVNALSWVSQPPGPSHLWLGPAADPAATAAAVRAVLPAGARVDGTAIDPARALLLTAPTAVAWGAAGAAVLALVGTAAAASAGRRAASGEAAALRAIGVSGRTRRGLRLAERGSMVGVGLVIGAMAGLAVTVILLPTLASGAAMSDAIGLAPAAFEAGILVTSTLALLAGLSVVVVLSAADERPPSSSGGQR